MQSSNTTDDVGSIEDSQFKERILELEDLTKSLTMEREHLRTALLNSQKQSETQVNSITVLEAHLAKLQQQLNEKSQNLQMQVQETEV